MEAVTTRKRSDWKKCVIKNINRQREKKGTVKKTFTYWQNNRRAMTTNETSI
jgi:hypothetical protein